MYVEAYETSSSNHNFYYVRFFVMFITVVELLKLKWPKITVFKIVVYSGARYEIQDSFLVIGHRFDSPVKLATDMPDN